MPKRKLAEPEDPIVYRDEFTLAPPPGEWRCEIVLGEDDLEKLMTGRVSRALMETAFRALSWRRGDQAWNDYDCACLKCQQAK